MSHSAAAVLAATATAAGSPPGSNFFLWSEANDDAAWTARGGYTAPTADATAAPDSTTTADLVTALNGASQLYFGQAPAGSPGSGYATVSIYAKPNGWTEFGIRESATNGYYGTFDLTSTGAVIEVSGATGTIEALANGWYRISITYTQASHGNVFFWVMGSGYASGSPHAYTNSPTSDGTKGCYVWGAQFDMSATLRGYAKTTTAPV